MPFSRRFFQSWVLQVIHQQLFKKNDTDTIKKYIDGNSTENDIPQYGHFSVCERRAPYAATAYKGSIALEASLVMPVVIAAFVVLMQLMQFMNVQSRIQSTLYSQTVKAAGYAYLIDYAEGYFLEGMDVTDYQAVIDIAENGVTELLIKNMVVNELGDDFFDSGWVKNGRDGIHVVLSLDVDSQVLDIILYYELEAMYNLFGLDGIPVVARARLNQWTGTTRVVRRDEATDDGESVYITPSGTVYHTYRDCPYLVIGLTSVKLEDIGVKRNASGGKYYACSSCGQNAVPGSNVYISKYGDRYHSNSKCHNVYRNVSEIPKSEVGNRRQCSKCSSRDGRGN